MLAMKLMNPRPNGDPKRIAFYVRCSTEEQNESPEGTIKNQEERLAATLRLKNQMGGEGGYGSHVGTYIDVKSGKDMNRPELRRLLQAIERGSVNVVMVTELSRLSRSIKDFSEIWEFMQKRGCQFLSLRENFDTSTASGEMMLYSLANFSQYERRQTSERVSANMEARARRGLWNGGVVPMGYEPDPENRGSLRIVEDEAKTVRAAFKALIDQGSVTGAARWLNSNGYRYGAELRGGGFRPRLQHFIFDSLYRMLTNPVYIAHRKVKTKTGSELAKAVWPPIITEETFYEAKTILQASKKQKTGRESRYPYLLSTRIRCGECGSVLVGQSAYGNSGKVGYYAHGSQIKREQTLGENLHRCQPFRVPAKKLEARVWEELVAIIEGTHREKFFEAIRRLERNDDGENSLDRMKKEKVVSEGKITSLAKRIANLPDGIPAEPFYAEMRELAARNTRLETEIRSLEQTIPSLKISSNFELEKLLEKFLPILRASEGISTETKRKVIHALIHQIRITKDGFEMHFYAASDQIKKGERGRSPLKSLDKNFSVRGSFKDLNGGPSENRTRTLLRAPDFESGTSTSSAKGPRWRLK